MELLDTLRRRCERRTETVDCGGLGVLTVQALPLRDCAALSAGADGKRAVFYAACRDLQMAGEVLRSEGTLFAPEEIMQHLSDEEVTAGASAVRRISGLPEMTEEQSQTGEQPEKRLENSRTEGLQETRERSSAAINRLQSRREFVQAFENHNSETRQESVEKKEKRPAAQTNFWEKSASEICGTDLGIFSEKAIEQNQDEPALQNSSAPENYGDGLMSKGTGHRETDKKSHNAGILPTAELKDFPQSHLHKRTAVKKSQANSAESSIRLPTELPSKNPTFLPQKAETENGGMQLDGSASLEVSRESRLKTGRKTNDESREIMPEFSDNGGENLRKIQSEFDGVTADFDEEVARPLLNGLLRAAGAR